MANKESRGDHYVRSTPVLCQRDTDDTCNAHIDKDINLAVALLLKNAIGRPDKIRLCVEIINLLQGEIGLKEGVLRM